MHVLVVDPEIQNCTQIRVFRGGRPLAVCSRHSAGTFKTPWGCSACNPHVFLLGVIALVCSVEFCELVLREHLFSRRRMHLSFFFLLPKKIKNSCVIMMRATQQGVIVLCPSAFSCHILSHSCPTTFVFFAPVQLKRSTTERELQPCVAAFCRKLSLGKG